MTTAAPPVPAPPPVLLGRNRSATRVRLNHVIRPDDVRWGAVVAFDGRWYRRGEPGPAGPLTLAAAASPDGTHVEVWGPAATPAAATEEALETATAWAGLRDDLDGVHDVLTSTPVLRRLVDEIGEVRLGRIPRVIEAAGRAIVEQLVQSKEAHRSIAQLVTRCGTKVGPHHWHWPRAHELGATPTWDLRRCGVSGRMTTAIHAAAVEDRRLERARADWAALDRRLLALPGVGPWTSAETRFRLGDPDAVSVGDYHLPTTVGYALAGPDGDGPEGTWTDAGMLELLAPYAGQRGRVIRLVETASVTGLVARRQRRAPRAALSAHRYW